MSIKLIVKEPISVSGISSRYSGNQRIVKLATGEYEAKRGKGRFSLMRNGMFIGIEIRDWELDNLKESGKVEVEDPMVLHQFVAVILIAAMSFVMSYISAYRFSSTETGDAFIGLPILAIGMALASYVLFFWEKIDRYGWMVIKFIFNGWVFLLIFVGLTYYIFTAVNAHTYAEMQVLGILIRVWLIIAVVGLIKLLFWFVPRLDNPSSD